MNRAIEILTNAVQTVCDFLLRPLDLMPERVGLVCFSIVTGVGTLWLFGRFTNQKLVATARDRMSAAVYEVRLFMDSPRRILSAQKTILYWSLRYLISTLPPILILSLPFAALLPHLEARYGLAPLPIGRPVLLEVVQTAQTDQPVSLSVAEGVEVTAPPLHIDAEHRTIFRLRLTEGTHRVVVKVAGAEVAKRLVADADASKVSVERKAGAANILSVGDEDVVGADSGIGLIRVDHPPQRLAFLGMMLPWWGIWLLVATAVALLLRKRLGVVL